LAALSIPDAGTESGGRVLDLMKMRPPAVNHRSFHAENRLCRHPGVRPGRPAAVQKVQYRHYRRARHRYRDGRKIACTPGGCHPIPRGCYPTPQLDWRGNPTGYDAIVCPRR
jgi:hypothetical protein